MALLPATDSPKVAGNFLHHNYVIDTGCNMQCAMDKADFTNLRPYDGAPINGIKGAKVFPQAIGTLRLLCNTNSAPTELRLYDSLLCPDMGANLISLDQLMARGAVPTLEPKGGFLTIANARFNLLKQHGLWTLDI